MAKQRRIRKPGPWRKRGVERQPACSSWEKGVAAGELLEGLRLSPATHHPPLHMANGISNVREHPFGYSGAKRFEFFSHPAGKAQ